MASLRAHTLRALLIALAVMLGVSLFGGSLIYAGSARQAIFDDLARAAVGVDVVAVPIAGAAKEGDRVGRPALDAVAAVPGVARVDGRVTTRLGLVGRQGRVVTNGAQVGLAISVPSWSGFSTFRLAAGQAPARPGETAIDQPTAAREGMAIGDKVTVLDRTSEPHQFAVVGLLDFGTSATFADTSVVALTDADLRALADTGAPPPTGQPVESERYAQIVVAAAPGTEVTALRQRVAAALGPAYVVSTGDEFRHDLAVEAAKYIDGFLATLRVTALVALAVAGLVVYNTFQILIAQRTREHALLRCVGARRRQIVELVVVESALIGLVASVGSVLFSLLAARALLIGQDVLGHGLPDYHLVVSPLAVFAPMVVGVVVTVASAVIPALSAGRVSPLAAFRAAAYNNPSTGGPSPRGTAGGGDRRYVVSLLAAVALAGCGFALLNSGRGSGFDGLPAMVGGAMVVFAALVVLMPLVVTTFSGPLRWMLGRLFGATGRVAMGNAKRHPVRFAATTTALMIGIAPLTTFAVLLATARVQGERELAENFPVDFVVSHSRFSGASPAFSGAMLDRLRATPEFGVVALSRVTETDADSGRYQVGAMEPGYLGGRLALEIRQGELGGLPPGTAAVTTSFALAHEVGVGDTITVGPDGDAWTARIVATYDATPVPAQVIVNWSDFTTHLSGDDYLLIRRSDTAKAASAAAALDANLVGDPLASVTSTGQRRESLVDSLGRRQNQVNALLGLSMVIAVLGIANTLSLSVLERTGESALLRALGLTRRQLVGMLLLEATLIALVGAAAGVAFGVGFGWLTARELINQYGHGAPAIPVGMITVYVAVAALAGAIASIVPARRAARASVISAMAE